MKRYNIMDEVESLTGEYIKYTDHESDVAYLKENAIIMEEEILKLVEQNKEMLDMLKKLDTDMGIDLHDWYEGELGLTELIEKIEGEQ